MDGATEIDDGEFDGLMIVDEFCKESTTTTLAAVTTAAVFDAFALCSMQVGELESIICVVAVVGVVSFMEGNATFLPIFLVALIFVEDLKALRVVEDCGSDDDNNADDDDGNVVDVNGVAVNGLCFAEAF